MSLSFRSCPRCLSGLGGPFPSSTFPAPLRVRGGGSSGCVLPLPCSCAGISRLTLDGYTRGDMGHPDGRTRLVHLLPARTGRPHCFNPQVLWVYVYLHFLYLRQHGDGCRRGVNPPLGLCGRHPLHPMGTALVTQSLVHLRTRN